MDPEQLHVTVWIASHLAARPARELTFEDRCTQLSNALDSVAAQTRPADSIYVGLSAEQPLPPELREKLHRRGTHLIHASERNTQFQHYSAIGNTFDEPGVSDSKTYIAFLDDDDVWGTRRLEHFLDAYDAYAHDEHKLVPCEAFKTRAIKQFDHNVPSDFGCDEYWTKTITIQAFYSALERAKQACHQSPGYYKPYGQGATEFELFDLLFSAAIEHRPGGVTEYQEFSPDSYDYWYRPGAGFYGKNI